MINKCKKCGHSKNGMYHKVFSSCARYKHTLEKYKQHNLLNNYLNKLPEQITEEDLNDWFTDDFNFITSIENEFLIGIYLNILKRGLKE